MREDSQALRFIVKLGGAAITEKTSFETLNHKALQRSVEQLKNVYKAGLRFVVVHGAGSFGHFQAKEASVHKGGIEQESVKSGFVKARLSVKKLNETVVASMVKVGIPAVGISPCGFWMTSNRQVLCGDVSGVKRLHENGLVPVLHGDAVLDDKLGCTILSGDVIMKHLAYQLHPQFVIFQMNVEALFDRPPEQDGSRQIRRVLVQKNGDWRAEGINSSMKFSLTSQDTTGGIQAKITESVEIACRGIDVLLVSKGSNASLQAMLNGRQVLELDQWIGTIISLEDKS